MSTKPNKEEAESKKSASKDQVLQETMLQLSAALPALKEILGDKKFEKRIKKAAKLLTGGLRNEAQKEVAPLKKTAPLKKVKAKPVKKVDAAVATVKKVTEKESN